MQIVTTSPEVCGCSTLWMKQLFLVRYADYTLRYSG